MHASEKEIVFGGLGGVGVAKNFLSRDICSKVEKDAF